MPSSETTDPIYGLEIRDLVPVQGQSGGYLAFDLSDVLDALGPRVRDLAWVVPDFEPGGYVVDADPAHREQANALFEDVQRRRLNNDPPLIIDGAALEDLAKTTSQTLDGVFVRFPPGSHSEQGLSSMADLSAFPISRASLLIKAIDTTLFVVITKSAEDIASISNHFKDVREADVALELGLH